MALTPKQSRFVDEYLIDLNGTQAAIRAGYSPRTANEQAARLLAKDSVRSAIAERMKERSRKTGVTADRIVRELAAMAFYDPAEIAKAGVKGPADIQNLPEEVRRAIVGWSWDKQGNFVLKLSPKTASLEQLGRHLGIFNDKLNVSHSFADMTDDEIKSELAMLNGTA